MAKAPTLPRWAKRVGNEIHVQPATVYPVFLARLSVAKTKATQYDLEVARRCFTTELRDATGGKIVVRILRDDAWRLDRFPAGEGADAGAQNFRKHYGTRGERLKVPQ